MSIVFSMIWLSMIFIRWFIIFIILFRVIAIMFIVLIVMLFIYALRKHYFSLSWISFVFICWSGPFRLLILIITQSSWFIILLLFIIFSSLIIFSFIVVMMMRPFIWMTMTLQGWIIWSISLIVAPPISLFFFHPVKSCNFIFIVLHCISLTLNHHGLPLIFILILSFIFNHIQHPLAILLILIKRVLDILITILNQNVVLFQILIH